MQDGMKVNVRWWLWLLFLLLPVAIGLGWGEYLDDDVYATFRHVRDLAAGQGTITQALRGQTSLRSPLYALALWLPAWLGIPLPQAGLVLSVLGWGVAAAAIYGNGRATRQPVAKAVAALLVACSPAVVATLGTEIGWTVALGCVGIGAGAQGWWRVQSYALALLLLVHFDWVTLAGAALLLAVRWVEEGRFPLRAALLLAIAGLGWESLALRGMVAPYTPLNAGVAEWGWAAHRLVSESGLYWLALSLIPLGLLGAGRNSLWAGLLWVAVAVLSGGAAAEAMVMTLAQCLTGLGVERVIRWIKGRNPIPANRVAMAMVVLLPLGAAQASSLWRRYQFRPVARRELQEEVGEWLRARTEPQATLFGSERVGYLAEQAVIAWDGGGSDEAELAKLLRALTENPPDYCVSFESIGWHYMRRTGWFRNDYELLQEFESPYDVTSPLTVWGRRATVFDEGERRPLDARLSDGVNLIGYRYWPEHIQPGRAVYVTLFLQATRPVTESFRPIVQMSIPRDTGDWMHWRQVDLEGECSVPLAWWQAGQVVADFFVVRAATDTPIGAYRLDVSMLAPDGESFLPIYRGDDDTSPLDRVMLGYVVVPWEGEMGQVQPVDAMFGDRIALLGFEATDRLSPTAEFDVVLYWEALRPPEDDYVVFVHLLDDEGRGVASHDGPPLEGWYPTGAWLPGDVVPDTHHLTLDSDIPAGTYQLQVGMYRWPSLERLPVWDGQGVEQPDRTVVLQSVEVR